MIEALLQVTPVGFLLVLATLVILRMRRIEKKLDTTWWEKHSEETLLKPGQAIADPVEEGFYRTPVEVHSLPEVEQDAEPISDELLQGIPKPRHVVSVGEGKYFHWDHAAEAWRLKPTLGVARVLVKTRLGSYVELTYDKYSWKGKVLEAKLAVAELLSANHPLTPELERVAREHMV